MHFCGHINIAHFQTIIFAANIYATFLNLDSSVGTQVEIAIAQIDIQTLPVTL